MSVEVTKALHTHYLEIPGVGTFVTSTSAGDPHSHVISADDVVRMRTTALTNEVDEIASALQDVDGPMILTESSGAQDHAHRARIGGRDFTTKGPETVTATLTTLSFPDVLTVDAVRSGRMPEPGTSGIPESLEQDVPGEFRYWLVEDQLTAARVRRALVEQGMFTDESVCIVGDEHRLVLRREDGELFIPPHAPGDPVDPGEVSSLESAEAVVNMVGKFAIMSAEATALTDPGSLLNKVMRFDQDALIEFTRGGEMEDVIVGAGLLPCCFQTRAFGDVAFFSTQLPDDDDVDFIGELPDDTLPVYMRQRDFTGGDIGDVSAQIMALSKQLADEPTARTAFLARVLIDQELTRRDDVRVVVLRALGYNLEQVSKRAFFPIHKVENASKRLVTGIVLSPNTADLSGDLIGSAQHDESAEDIRRLSYDFMEFSRSTGLQHQITIDGRATIVQSFVTMSDQDIGGRMVVEGTWIITMRIRDDRLWEMIQSGELTGFSIGGYGRRESL